MYLTKEKQQELLPLLLEQCRYNPRTGSILVERDSVLTSSSSSLVISGFLHRVPQKLAAWLLSGEDPVPPDREILCRNLDEQDLTRRNLCLVDKTNYRRIKRIICNTTKHYKLKEHPSDIFKVYTTWIDLEKGSKHKKVFEDSVVARKFIKKNLIDLMKELEYLGVNLEEAEIFLGRPMCN
jgi:hypothetical protein